MYNREQVIEESKKYFNGDELAATVFADKYALRNIEGDYLELTPDDMHKRLSKEFARIEKKYPNPLSEKEIYEMIKGFQHVVPQGSPMAAIGNEHQIQSTSNCFVIDSPVDSYGGICKTDQELVQLAKRRSGIGFNISNIRPKGSITKNAAKTTDGIAVFMERFSNSCREVAQSGRRGALLLALDIRHPEIETFINIKKDKTKVTGANISIILTDEFMNAVKNNSEYEQKWPIDSDSPKISKMVNAKDIWDKIINSAWQSAEPGLLFWGNVEKNTPSDLYKDFKAIATNPCTTGETLVYVADGRGLVTIKDLAEEEKDVDVFCYDNDNKLTIRTMRNPRITGYNQKILKITFEDGNSIRVTENHKFMLKSGEYVEAKDLKTYDQLKTLTRYEETNANFYSKKENRSKYFWLTTDKKPLVEHRLIAERNYGNIDNKVIHHIDFNSKNNSPKNLKPMTREDHDAYHGECIRGDKNPMRRAAMEWDEQKWNDYSLHMSMSVSGLQNGRAYQISNDDIKQHAINLTKKLNRRFSRNEWEIYAKEHTLPLNFSDFRETDEYTTIYEMSLIACKELGLENQDYDNRLLKTIQKMEQQGYNCKIENNKVLVERVCEHCGKSFYVEYLVREQGFCSVSCSLEHINSNKDFQERRINSTKNTYKQKQEKTKNRILDVYTKLKVDLGRDPLCLELQESCKKESVPFRLYTKFGFKSYEEIKTASINHNHRVVSIEFDGYENVYNGTVDDFHNFFVGGFRVNDEKNSIIFLNNKQCGEIVLGGGDSCRLISMNLLSFVENKFTPESFFNYEKFGNYVFNAQKMMDDLIDLELESIDKIVKKIESDPEEEDVKSIELNLWKKIKTICEKGRRTGLGITALGDTLAAIGVRYGSKESVNITEKIYKTLCLNAYKSSITMAKERGSFSVWNYDLEKDHEYISKIIKELPESIQKDYEKYGRRNIALTTTAPAGSVSILTQTSSGIEPVFKISYKRRKKIMDNSTKPDFVDVLGDKWQEYKVYHHQFNEWSKVTNNKKEEDSPWYKATSEDVDWETSVDLQAAAQKWVDHSISKTCNLPNNVSEELVGKVYMRAWESGCKGFTVYRDGCRDGVLITGNETNKSSFKENNAPKRPETLECDVHNVKIKGENWTIIVGLMDGKPYEIFGGKSKYVSLAKKTKHGKLIKHPKKKGHDKSIYDLKLGDDEDIIIQDISNVFENPTEGEFTRIISLALRHGSPIVHVVEQLQKEENSDMYSFSKVVARVLKSYVKEGTVSTQKCPNCGAKIIFTEGCKKCSEDCGYSACS